MARIYSTKVEYSPSWDKEPEGKIKNTIELAFNKPDAWALALPFTDQQYVDSGTHMVPVFKGAPEWGPALRVLSEKGASLEVRSLGILRLLTFSLWPDFEAACDEEPADPALFSQGSLHPNTDHPRRTLL